MLVLASLASAAQAQIYRIPGEQTADFGSAMGDRTGLLARGQNIGVLQRPRTDWEPVGLRFQALRVRPTFAATLASDDNIFAKSQGQSDAIISLRPSILAETDWARHYVSAFARLNSRSYLDHSNEDVVDWAVGANGRYDVAPGSSLQAGGGYEQTTEPRTAVSSPVEAAEPVRFKFGKVYLGGVKEFNRARFTLAADLRDLNYADTAALDGSTIKGRERDRTSTTIGGRAEYAVSGATSLFVNLSGNDRNYRQDGTSTRDSKGVDVMLGASFDITNLMRGDLAVGYSRQDYDSAAFKDVSGASVRGKVEYFPTPLITLTAIASQSIEDTDFEGAAGFLLTSGQLRADYELRRNIVISGRVGYQKNDFKGAIDRKDKRPSAALSMEFLLNRHIGLEGGYEWIKQDSSGADQGVDFSSNRFYLTTTYKF